MWNGSLFGSDRTRPDGTRLDRTRTDQTGPDPTGSAPDQPDRLLFVGAWTGSIQLIWARLDRPGQDRTGTDRPDLTRPAALCDRTDRFYVRRLLIWTATAWTGPDQLHLGTHMTDLMKKATSFGQDETRLLQSCCADFGRAVLSLFLTT